MAPTFTLSKTGRILLILFVLVPALWVIPSHSSISRAQEGETTYETEAANLPSQAGAALSAPHAEVTAAEMERMERLMYRRRLETTQPYNIDTSNLASASPATGGIESASSAPASIESTAVVPVETRFHGIPSDFVIGSNIFNSQADNAGNSTLAEPAAANEGPNIFYAGNFRHNEFSTDGGITWNNVAVPGGPADAPTACCDWDVIYDQARGVTFISTLYLNAARTNGIVRIFVRRNIALGNNCFYDIDPAGTSNNTVPDYPHIQLSNDFLYLATNNTGGAAGGRAQVRRFNIDQMADCATVSGNVFSYVWAPGVGQRIFVPVEGARETMFWFMNEDADTLRIFRWPETSTSVFSSLHNIAASTFGVDEDCTGGTGNNDWWDRLGATITGFNHRGALGNGRLHLYWNVASDASHLQGHIHGAVFAINPSGSEHVVGALLAQPAIFNNGYCYGFPQVSANERGDIGISLAVGGNAGAACSGLGCSAAQAIIGIDDDFTAGLGVFGATGGNFNIFAGGTHNRADARYGDYFVIHPHEPCDLWFETTGYALNGGTAVNNVNARLAEFGRRRDKPCYDRWDDEDPVP